jgi:hypothetical protein
MSWEIKGFEENVFGIRVGKCFTQIFESLQSSVWFYVYCWGSLG